ncbi:MAG TPA: hypothetical protein VHC22_21010 [Pirellulales bacterium]|nr:hypothetical protein [Pirellulales bacterium]
MRKTTTCWALALMLLAGHLQAQDDDLPPPRRGAPERRANPPQRGDRLRKLANPNGPLGQLFESLAGDPNGGQPALDIPKLNDGIAALVEPLLDEERNLEYLRLRFDPTDTNLARDVVHVIGAARLRHSRWSDDPTQIDLDLRGNMQRREDGRPQGTLDGELRFQTDVISLANRAKARFSQQMERRAQQGAVREAPLNAEEAARARLRETLAKTPPLQNMDDVVDFVLTFAGLRLTAINERIEELKVQVSSGPDERSRLDAAEQLAEARRERDQMLDVRPRVERDDNGRAVAMRINLERSQVDEATRVEQLKVELTATKVTIRLVGSTMQGMELYGLFKPIVLNTLTRIQMRDADTMRLGRGMFRGYLDQLDGALRDGDEGLPPPPAAGPPSAPPPPAAPTPSPRPSAPPRKR